MNQLSWVGNHGTVLRKGAQDVHVGTQNEFQRLGKCGGEMERMSPEIQTVIKCMCCQWGWMTWRDFPAFSGLDSVEDTHQLFRFQENDLHEAPGGLRVCVYAKSCHMLLVFNSSKIF